MNKIKKLLKPKLKLLRGTRFVSFLFIAASIVIAAGILWAANMYYNLDTTEVIVGEIQRVTNTLRATYSLIVGGSDNQNPETGFKFEVVGDSLFTGNVLINNVSNNAQELRFEEGGASPSQYVGFKAPDSLTSSRTYIWPHHDNYPPEDNMVLTWTTGNQLKWQAVGGVGAGDIQAVGDCSSGSCFTGGTDGGNSLYFEGATPNDFEILLTAADPTSDYTITLPAATGTVALGTGTQDYVAYWTGTNTLGSEQYLATSRGGIGESSASWNGMVQVLNGNWGTVTGTANYAAYWSDANTIAAEQYLDVTRGGTGVGSLTQYGILYGNGTSDIGATAAGTTNQLLVSGGGTGAPSWANLADLIEATNGLSESGTTSLTLKLGGTLSEDTTISQGNYAMIFKLTGTGDFKVQNDSSTDIFTVTDDDKILFKTYPLAETGKQIFREVIPIMGFDLPVQCSTVCDTENAQISRRIEEYPFATSAPTGSTRKHKLIIRYATSDSTTSINFRVYDATTSSYVDQGGGNYDITVSASPGTELGDGTVATANVVLPSTSTDDWYLTVRGASGLTVKIYQIFLAAYDEIQ